MGGLLRHRLLTRAPHEARWRRNCSAGDAEAGHRAAVSLRGAGIAASRRGGGALRSEALRRRQLQCRRSPTLERLELQRRWRGAGGADLRVGFAQAAAAMPPSTRRRAPVRALGRRPPSGRRLLPRRATYGPSPGLDPHLRAGPRISSRQPAHPCVASCARSVMDLQVHSLTCSSAPWAGLAWQAVSFGPPADAGQTSLNSASTTSSPPEPSELDEPPAPPSGGALPPSGSGVDPDGPPDDPLPDDA